MRGLALCVLMICMAESATASVYEIEFKGSGGMNLAGELMTPSGKGPFPCVLLLPGSGPSDRDGDQPPALKTELLKQIAVRFASAGIATFRFDKRPVHQYRDQWPKDPGKFSDFFSFNHHIGDVKAAYAAMKAHKMTDPERLGIMGHSEGGLFTASTASSLGPKAVALVGAAGRTMDHTIR